MNGFYIEHPRQKEIDEMIKLVNSLNMKYAW